MEIDITEDQRERAKELYDFDDLKDSITSGKSNIFGALGEIIIADYYTNMGLEIDFNSTYDYDLIMQGYKIDVKTKKTTVEPQDHFFCSIPDCNTTQNCDFYYFVRITEDLETAYILGFKSKDAFFKEAIFNKKGEVDDGFTFKADCYNLKISQLRKIREDLV